MDVATRERESSGRDPKPWVHTSGVRVADPRAEDSPIGGYTYRPRKGYDDYPDRYVSTRYGCSDG